MNTHLILQIFYDIARPLLILVVIIFLFSPFFKWLKKRNNKDTGISAKSFDEELEKVIQRANHVLDDPILLKKQSEKASCDAKHCVLDSWSHADSELKSLAFEHCRVDPEIIPYPIDYALFELEMKKIIGNTTIGLYRDLTRLKDMVAALPQAEQLDPGSAAKYELLAGYIEKRMKQGPLPGIGGIF